MNKDRLGNPIVRDMDNPKLKSRKSHLPISPSLNTPNTRNKDNEFKDNESKDSKTKKNI